LIVPLGGLLYFIGNITENAALKVLVIQRPRTPRESYVGIVLSIDGDGTAIAARILLRRTEASNDIMAGVGPPIDVELAREEIGDIDLDKIRNRIPFELEEATPVFMDLKGRDSELDNDQLVMEVRQALLRDERPLFRYKSKDGREFNPADDKFYTFNSALTIWHGGPRPPK
jgi:hypothetical protein